MADTQLSALGLGSFADELAARRPVPGGGAAAAYAGALAAALCSMTGEYTLGKARYAAVSDDVRRMLDETRDVRERLVALVDADAAAFEPLSRAYAIPADDPVRPSALEEATRGALAAPLETMRQCCRAVALLEEMGEKGSRMLLSDVGCGAALARAALEAAALNVFVNTRSLADRTLADELGAQADAMLAAWAPRAEAVVDAVSARLRERG